MAAVCVYDDDDDEDECECECDVCVVDVDVQWGRWVLCQVCVVCAWCCVTAHCHAHSHCVHVSLRVSYRIYYVRVHLYVPATVYRQHSTYYLTIHHDDEGMMVAV